VTGHRHEWAGKDPLGPSALRRMVPDLAGHDVYLCGPSGMQRAVTASLRAAGVPRGRIHSEDFVFEGAGA